MRPEIHSIHIGMPKAMHDERGEWVSSIARTRVDGPLRATMDGLVGDKVHQPYHGGPDAALCVHPMAHYNFWRERFQIELKPGHLGENLVVEAIEDQDVCVGDIVKIGSARIQVSAPRVPCETQARRAGRADWVRLTIRENRTGFYVRVLEPGELRAGDAWIVEERKNQRGSIAAINRCFYREFDPEFAEEIAAMPGLADWWKQQIHEKVGGTSGHWSESILK